eukprot:GHUV01009857.1.p1 GENE.GHUV01009857.1~~GHUV01009857.1.p1  ORF type:complete len:379 (+),score=144.97 GHUV01009857.1:202-1338(+)
MSSLAAITCRLASLQCLAGGPGVPAQTHRPQQDSRSNSRHEQGSRSHYDKRQQSDSTYEQHDRRDGCEQDRRSSCRDRDERSSRYDREGRYSRDRYQDNRYERSSGARYHSETCDEPCRRFSEGPGHSRHSEDRYSSREQDDRRPYQQQQQHSGSTYTDEPASKRGKWESSSVLADSNNTPAGAAAGVSSGSAAAAPAAAGGTATLSAMEQYMQRLEEQARKKREDDEEEERRRLAQPLLKETAFDRRKVVAVFKDDGQRGHHLDDFIPKEELAKFMAQCGDKQLQQQVEQETAIGADNIGHKLLQKMGWKEGQGIGAKGNGRTAPVTAVKQDNLGLGAQAHGAVEETDDPFEQYRKRMMLGYKHRPNPLGNPRRAYY